jgi:cytochrome c-type biogenesis protein CcmF
LKFTVILVTHDLREAAFLANNWILLFSAVFVLFATLFPTLSEALMGQRLTVGPPFFNTWMLPIGLMLLTLTGIGPLLAWRKTSFESLKRNFMWPALGALAVGILMIAFGVRPWADIAYLYALMAAMLATLVGLTVASEFIRGGRVISRHTGQNLLASMVHLFHRNTRRYGGYIVHFGVAVVIIGILGTPFNQDKEKEMGFGDKMTIGPYTLVCESYTQDDNPNYSNEWAIINVFKGDRKIETMYPERRFYKASQQPQTLPRIRSTYKEDLYLTYEGLNEQTGRPIIKAHLNPLVMWIWVGVLIMIGGTVLALIPNALPVRVSAPARIQAAPVGAGD